MKHQITTEDIFTHGEHQGYCDTPVSATVEFNELPVNAPGALATQYRVPDDMIVTLYDDDGDVASEPHDFEDRWYESYIEVTDKNVIVNYYAKHHDTELCIRFPKGDA